MSPFFASEILPILPCPGLGSGPALHNPHVVHSATARNTPTHIQYTLTLCTLSIRLHLSRDVILHNCPFLHPSLSLFSLSPYLSFFSFSLHILQLHHFTLLYSTLFYTTLFYTALLWQSTPAIQDPLRVSSYHLIPSHLTSLWLPRFTRIYSTLPPCTPVRSPLRIVPILPTPTSSLPPSVTVNSHIHSIHYTYCIALQVPVSLMTVTSLVMQNRRGLASGKRPLRLPIIAPKEDAPGKLESSLIAPPRIRLPPRSRTGCWYVLYSFLSFVLSLAMLTWFRTCRVSHIIFSPPLISLSLITMIAMIAVIPRSPDILEPNWQFFFVCFIQSRKGRQNYFPLGQGNPPLIHLKFQADHIPVKCDEGHPQCNVWLEFLNLPRQNYIRTLTLSLAMYSSRS